MKFNQGIFCCCIVSVFLLIVFASVSLTDAVSINDYASQWNVEIDTFCELIGYEERDCEYECDDDIFCDGREIILSGVVNQCGNSTLNTKPNEWEEDLLSSCSSSRGHFSNNGKYEIGSEYKCWIKSCDEGIFTLTNPENNESSASDAYMRGGLMYGAAFLIIVLYCVYRKNACKQYNPL